MKVGIHLAQRVLTILPPFSSLQLVYKLTSEDNSYLYIHALNVPTLPTLEIGYIVHQLMLPVYKICFCGLAWLTG